VTSKDVAALAGVSQSAVSRTFTSGASVSATTRAKVMHAARELGYEPNLLARSLISRETRLIGILMNHWNNPFYVSALRGFGEGLQARDYQLVLRTVNDDADLDQTLRRLLQYRVVGVISIAARPSAEAIDKCRTQDVPVLLFNREAGESRASAVYCGQADIGRHLATLLIGGDYRRIAIVGGDGQVKAGIETIFAAAGAARSVRVVATLPDPFSYNAGRQVAAELFSGDLKPDCIVCASDLTAFGVLDCVTEDLRLRVPDDVGIVGFGNMPSVARSPGELTTMQLPLQDMVDRSIAALLERVGDPDLAPVQIPVQVELLARNSTRALKHRRAAGWRTG
jgi:DNA-binding LacI/PurR family transcriptional regulator